MKETKEVTFDASEEGQLFRHYTGVMAIIIKVIAVIIPLYCIAFVFNVAGLYFGVVFYPATFRALFLGVMLVLTFLLVPATKKSAKGKLPWYDILLCFISLVPSIYVFINFESYGILQDRIWATPFEEVLFFVQILVIFEAVRRTVGLPVLILAILFLLHAGFAYLLPGLLGAPRMSL
jgi:TRAP-type uncharacterized transport system fused permease subunit